MPPTSGVGSGRRGDRRKIRVSRLGLKRFEREKVFFSCSIHLLRKISRFRERERILAI